jgi:hypothetical protein
MGYTMRSLDVTIGNLLAGLLPAGTPLWAAGQDAVVTTDSYVTYRVMEDTPKGQPTRKVTTTPEMAGDPPAPTGRYLWEQDQLRGVQLEVQTYGPDAAELMARIGALYAHPASAYNAMRAGVVYQSMGPAQRVPGERLAEIEDRWITVFTLEYVRRDALAIDTIDTPDQVQATPDLC